MGATKTELQKAVEARLKKKKGLAPGRTGTNTVDAAGRETFTKPGHKGWKIDTGPPQKKTIKLPKAPSKPKKTTHGLGKAGISTVVDLGKNPTQAQYAKGKDMLNKQRKAQGLPKIKAPTAPKAKAPAAPSPKANTTPPAKQWKPINVAAEIEKHQRLSPHLPGDPHDKTTPAYVWKRSENPHLKAKKSSQEIKLPGIVTAALAAAGAVTAGVVLKDQVKRNTSPQVEAAKARKPQPPKPPKVETPKAPKTPAKVEVEVPKPKPVAKVEAPKPPKVYDRPKRPDQRKGAQNPAAAFEAAERADHRAKFKPPPLPNVEPPKVEAPKPREIPVGASPKEIAAIEEAASKALVGREAPKPPSTPRPPAAPKPSTPRSPEVPAPPKQDQRKTPRTPKAEPPVEVWDAARRKESLTAAREARKSGNVEAMNEALKNLPPSGKKAAKERVNLEAGIESASNKPKGVAGQAVDKVVTRRRAKKAGKEAEKAEKEAKRQERITAEGGEAAEIRASQQAKERARTGTSNIPPLPQVDVPEVSEAQKQQEAAARRAAAEQATQKQAAAKIEGAAQEVTQADTARVVPGEDGKMPRTGDRRIENRRNQKARANKPNELGAPKRSTRRQKGSDRRGATPEVPRIEVPTAQPTASTPAVTTPPTDNKAIYDAAREAQKSGDAARIQEALKTLPKGTKKTARLTQTLNAALEAAKNRPATPAPAPAPATQPTGRTKSQERKIKQEERAQQRDQKKRGTQGVKDPKPREPVLPGQAKRRIQGQPLDADAQRQADADNKLAQEAAKQAQSEADVAKAQEKTEWHKPGEGPKPPVPGPGSDKRKTTDLLTPEELEAKTTKVEPGPKPTEAGQIVDPRANADFELKLELPGQAEWEAGEKAASDERARVEKARQADHRRQRIEQGVARAVQTPGEGIRLAEDRAKGRSDLGIVGRENIMTDSAQDRRIQALEATGALNAPTETDIVARNEAQQIVTEARQDRREGKDRREKPRRTGVDRVQAEIEKARSGVDLLSQARDDRQGDRREAPERRAEVEVKVPELPTPQPARSTAEGAKAVEAQADKILSDAGYKPFHDPTTETEAEQVERNRQDLLDETRRSAIEASEAVEESSEKQLKNRAEIEKQQTERARNLPRTRVGTADFQIPDITDPKVQQQLVEGPRYIYQPDTTEMEASQKARSKRRARLAGAIAGMPVEQRAPRDRRLPAERRVGKAGPRPPEWERTEQRRAGQNQRVENIGRPRSARPVPDLTTPEMGQLLNAPEGRPGHVPPEGRTDRRQGEFGKRIDTTTAEGQAEAQKRYAQRNAPKAGAPLTSPAIRGETETKPAEPYKGKGGVNIRGMGRLATIGTAVFAAINASKAGAEELYEGGSVSEAADAFGDAFIAEAPGVAKDLATFTAADIFATRAVPALAESTARQVGNTIATRTAQGTAGREIANAILRQTGKGVVRAGTAAVGTAAVAGVVAPGVVEAARTGARYATLPLENRAATAHAEQHKAGAERAYGTPERATATRKGWNPDTGKPYSTDELYKMADEISGASAEWNSPEAQEKRAKEEAKTKRRKAIEGTMSKYYNKYADFVHDLLP
jgi:hypothetical protein